MVDCGCCLPLADPPGDAQAAFGEAMVVIAGVESKAHFRCHPRYPSRNDPKAKEYWYAYGRL